MNKYKESLKIAYEMMNQADWGSMQIGCAQLKTLQELVEKETPMKPIDGMTGLTFKDAHKCKLCPKCKGKGLAIKKEWKYCPNCGQKLRRQKNE